MIAALVVVALLGAQDPIVAGRIADAQTRAPIAGALITGAHGSAISSDSGRFVIAAHVGDTLSIRRIGYIPVRAIVGSAPLLVLLRISASVETVIVLGDSAYVPMAASRSADDLRAAGATTLADALARMPFVSSRSSRGGIALSMRASRPEQVLVLLDGVPLNDPATGAADVSDVPLAALGAVTAMPGASAARYGSGASGGVLALTSAGGSAVSLDAGSFGRVDASAAASGTAGGARIRVGAELAHARNDFPFVNSVAPRDTVERRANADESRLALFATVTSPDVAATVLATRIERGLGGAMNVRVYDEARGTTERALASISTVASGTTLTASARVLDVAYDDPRAAIASRTTSLSGDAGVSRFVAGAGVSAGAGIDHVDGSALRTTDRPRLFVGLDRAWVAGPWWVAAAARADAIRDAGANVSPSLLVERHDRVTLFARVAQAFRAPSFYDLYFASPQWVDPARTLRPERVTLDAELGARAVAGTVMLSASIFERRTHDAIVWFPGTFSWSPNNVDREVGRGADARLSVASRVVDVDIWGGIRSTHLTVDGLEAPTPYVPYADGGALVGKRIGAIALSASMSAIGRRPFVSVPDPTRAVELPAVAIADAAISWSAPTRVAVVTAAVHDIADTRWQSIVNYPMPGRSLSLSLTIHP